MAEVLATFGAVAERRSGVSYGAQAIGAPSPSGLWEGWIEFTPLEGGSRIRTPRETTQPNRQAVLYWASGLSAVYLEGALRRALDALAPTAKPLANSIVDRPTARFPPVRRPPHADEPVLDPFSVGEKGEGFLRQELNALATWHLVNILRAYELTDESETALRLYSSPELIELIVTGIRDRSAARSRL